MSTSTTALYNAIRNQYTTTEEGRLVQIPELSTSFGIGNPGNQAIRWLNDPANQAFLDQVTSLQVQLPEAAIPPEFAQLRKLKSLTLFTPGGETPSGLDQLKSLKKLRILEAGQTETDAATISLYKAIVPSSQQTGLQRPIPLPLDQRPKLEEFSSSGKYAARMRQLKENTLQKIYANKWFAEHPEELVAYARAWFAARSEDLQQITVVTLPRDWSEKPLSSFPAEITSLPNLSTLTIQRHNIEQVPLQLIAQLSHLTLLDLRGNPIYAEPSGITNPNLTLLWRNDDRPSLIVRDVVPASLEPVLDVVNESFWNLSDRLHATLGRENARMVGMTIGTIASIPIILISFPMGAVGAISHSIYSGNYRRDLASANEWAHEVLLPNMQRLGEQLRPAVIPVAISIAAVAVAASLHKSSEK